MELITAAYATEVGDDEEVFRALADEAERRFQEQDLRFEMTSQDLARTYSL